MLLSGTDQTDLEAPLSYRKIEKLELDSLFRAWSENDLFARIARDTIEKEVAIDRAVLWNKAAGGGTELPWHQDDEVFWGLGRAPCLQGRTAFDDAPIDAGWIAILPGSHHTGLVTPDGGTVPLDLVDRRCSKLRVLSSGSTTGKQARRVH